MATRFIIASFLLLLPSVLRAQEVNNGSVSTEIGTKAQLPRELLKADSLSSSYTFSNTASNLTPFGVGSAPATGHTFSYDFSNAGQIASWRSGHLYGMNSQVYNPMFGTIANVGVGAVQRLGDHWTFNANLQVNKYSLSQRFNTFGLSGSATYKASDNIGFTVFGNYESSPFFSPRGGLHALGDVGGFMSVKTNNGKWGLDVGARAYYDPISGRWHNLPIVMPYYNLNGQKLGFDLGGLLYQIFRSASQSSGGHHQGPPVPPGGGTPATGVLMPRPMPVPR
ncbi:MAG: hypothetical protein IKR18_08395 [Bacteroidaceae bacterium]|nr:hypothetical protein [Bacteroidaceae bacterium]